MRPHESRALTQSNHPDRKYRCAQPVGPERFVVVTIQERLLISDQTETGLRKRLETTSRLLAQAAMWGVTTQGTTNSFHFAEAD